MTERRPMMKNIQQRQSYSSDSGSSHTSDDGWNVVRAETGGTRTPEPSFPSAEDLITPPRRVASAPTITTITSDDKEKTEDPTITTITSDNKEKAKEDGDPAYQRANASGIAAAVLGMLVGGPLVGVICSGLSVWAATNRNDAAGDVARSLGDVALYAGDQAKELEAKYGMVKQVKDVLGGMWMGVKERAIKIDEKQHVTDRTKDAADSVRRMVTTLNEEHHIVERTIVAWDHLWDFVSCKYIDEMEEKEKEKGETMDGSSLHLEKTVKAD